MDAPGGDDAAPGEGVSSEGISLEQAQAYCNGLFQGRGFRVVGVKADPRNPMAIGLQIVISSMSDANTILQRISMQGSPVPFEGGGFVCKCFVRKDILEGTFVA